MILGGMVSQIFGDFYNMTLGEMVGKILGDFYNMIFVGTLQLNFLVGNLGKSFVGLIQHKFWGDLGISFCGTLQHNIMVRNLDKLFM